MLYNTSFTDNTWIGIYLQSLRKHAGVRAMYGRNASGYYCSNLFISKIRKFKAASGFLNGVNAAALGLMLFVALQFAKFKLNNINAILILLAAIILLLIKKVNVVWIIIGSAAMGWLLASAKL